MTIDLNKLQTLAEAAKLDPAFESQTLWEAISPEVVLELITHARKTEKHWECEFIARGKKLTEVEREVESLRAENERLKEALKFYANRDDWGAAGNTFHCVEFGATARKALEGK